jgi:hypothetical protein
MASADLIEAAEEYRKFPLSTDKGLGGSALCRDGYHAWISRRVSDERTVLLLADPIVYACQVNVG